TVLAVVDEPVGYDDSAAERRRDDREPLVVDPPRWNRQGPLDHAAPQDRCGARDQVAPEQDLEAAARVDAGKVARAHAERLEEAQSEGFAVRVDERRIRVHEADLLLCLEDADEPLQPLGAPTVILVAQCKELTGRRTQSTFEIAGHTVGLRTLPRVT